MNILFYIASAIAILSTLLVVTGRNAVHALLYLIVSLLAVSLVFFLLGAPFIAALEVIIYAGAIMILFVFVVMLLNVTEDIKKEHELLKPKTWIGPCAIVGVLLSEMIYILINPSTHTMAQQNLSPTAVGALLFTTYSLVVELAAFLLIAGIIGAYHLGEKEALVHHRYLKKEDQNA